MFKKPFIKGPTIKKQTVSKPAVNRPLKRPTVKRSFPKRVQVKHFLPINKNIGKILPYQHFIIIRFSLAFSKGNMQNMNYTLNDDRLEKRFKLFENICLPSLINQTKKDNITVLINITDNMPEKWKNKLNELITNYKFIQIQEFDHTMNEKQITCLHNKFLEKYMKPETKIVATSRLDDDDALSPNYTTILSKYMSSKYINNVISVSSGYYFNPINKQCSMYNKSLLAIGLTLIQYVNKYEKFPYGIYSKQHTEWNKFANCINLTNVKYLRSVHDTNNSIKNGINTRVPKNNMINNLSVVKKIFPGVVF